MQLRRLTDEIVVSIGTEVVVGDVAVGKRRVPAPPRDPQNSRRTRI